jgi:hypothetical protein
MIFKATKSIGLAPTHRPRRPAMQRALPCPRRGGRLRRGACSRRSTCTAAIPAGSRPNSIHVFVPGVIEAIGMRAHGPLLLERSGDGKLEGWSAMRFQRDAFDHHPRRRILCRCFIDVFSCREFDPEIAATIAVAHVGDRRTLRVLQR